MTGAAVRTTSQLIHHLHAHIATLTDLADKRITLNRMHAHTSTASAPTPVNLTAMDLLGQIGELCLLLCRAAGMHPPTGLPAGELLVLLDDDAVTVRLDARGDADDIRRVLESAATHVTWICEPDERTRYVGVCTACGYGIWVDEHTDLDHGTYRCAMCGASGNLSTVVKAHRLRLMVSGVTGGAAELARLLRTCGYHTNANTIRSWARRHRIEAAGTTEDGRPAYALADVLRLLGGWS